MTPGNPERQTSVSPYRLFFMQKIRVILLILLGICSAKADSLTNRLEQMRLQLPSQFTVPVAQWRFSQTDITNAEQPNFDDSSWQKVGPGASWEGTNWVWFRATVTVPATVEGQAVADVPVRFEAGMNGRCILYVDGVQKDDFRGDNGRYTLTEHAQPGQTFSVALRVKGQPHNKFHFARLYCDLLPDLERYLDEADFVTQLIDAVPSEQQTILKSALDASEGCIQFTTITPDSLASARTQLAAARAALLPVAEITGKYDVYYIGHSHIDMNWLWTWADTIDTCRRTWNSAMNLMDEFPDFRFVQSQPGAYVPIEVQYPEEFARMQRMSASGQWDIVGGLWNESDTDIPSGEGLARSFQLGQDYFKSKFGKYAVTGWLPDSFGHTWQLPQIMQLAGIKYFYHMRCGNGMELTWWESPDGSRVLKANTRSYDAKPQLEQLVVPMQNAARFNMPQSVVIFGVGDHGGGPTREQILKIQSFKDDPIFPHVHFISADDYFDQLAQQPTAATLPVVDNDLQYTFEGCYTTHADLKKALRESENNLYSAEVLSSLAAMTGEPYPVAAFDDAWKPTAFAQFHDIAAGSAIHSTYDWMHEQLAPAFQFEKEQTDKSLNALTADVNTRGAGTNAIVVWNTLSFSRDDVVKVTIPGVGQYHSVLDSNGRQFPVQVMDGNTLVFVARDVPAFGHKVYFPSANASLPDGVTVHYDGNVYSMQSPVFIIQIDKKTGAVSQFYSKKASWNVFGNALDGNALELLGDNGSAWTIRLTGEDKTLAAEGATVSVLDNGPVFARVRVSHAYGKSTYTQDLLVYGALPRLDIPTSVNWQENGQMLKIRLPVNAMHPEASAQIPFGSKERPVNGQECPGQKWMDVSQTVPTAVKHAVPLDLSSLFNASCADNFDGDGAKYPEKALPKAGVHRLGTYQVPFKLPGYRANQFDNVAASEQHIAIPANADGNTLYLLAARSKEKTGTDIGFQLADGKTTFRAFDLNNWKMNSSPENEVGVDFPYEHPRKNGMNNSPRMWIVQVPIPDGARELVLPNDPGFHVFAATIGPEAEAPARYGLSVLNDSKYGFDVKDGVFRLTALRSSNKPDPEPDKGMQQFTYSLYPHAGNWQAAHTDEQALGLNIPLLATMTTSHEAARAIPSISITNLAGQGDLIVSGLKRTEDGSGYILRFYEADGKDTVAKINFDQPMQVQQTDILERPTADQSIEVQRDSATLAVGHNKIVTLRLTPGS